MNNLIQKRAQYWATASVFDEQTRSEVQALVDADARDELEDRFYRDLAFGTAGLRGIIGAGSARMNLYNIRRAAWAVGSHLRDHFGKAAGGRPVAITYDSRHYSQEFARATAEVLGALGIATLVTDKLRPVPLLSYLVRTRKCLAGICLTASHNPPNYNGFKVYWETGGQIVPPHDQAIMDYYNALERFEDIPFMAWEEAVEKGLVAEVGEELAEAYLEELATLSVDSAGRDGFGIAFTPLHGTAGEIVPEALKRFGFQDVFTVPAQKEPDGDFPTVKFPNPEDPAAMEMALNLAREKGAQLVLGTDPDCDRIGILVREGEEYWYLTGNQIGTLLLEYLLGTKKAAGTLPPNPLVIKTIVTTELQNRIGEFYGATVEETLTGFKWIGQRIEEYEQGKRTPYREYVGGGEEANGFLGGRMVRDKDGINACCLAAEMVAAYRARGKSPRQVLFEVFRRHGIYEDFQHVLTLPGKSGAEKIARMMEAIRTSPPQEMDGGSLVRRADVLVGRQWLGGKQLPLELPQSDVLQFWYDNGLKVSVRPSGTEPKIKFYFTLVDPVDEGASDAEIGAQWERLKERALRVKQGIVQLLPAS